MTIYMYSQAPQCVSVNWSLVYTMVDHWNDRE